MLEPKLGYKVLGTCTVKMSGESRGFSYEKAAKRKAELLLLAEGFCPQYIPEHLPWYLICQYATSEMVAILRDR